MWRGLANPRSSLIPLSLLILFDLVLFIFSLWFVFGLFFFCNVRINWIELNWSGLHHRCFNRRALYTAVEQHIQWLYPQQGALCYHFLHIEISLIVSSISLRLNGFGFLEAWPVKMYRNVFPIMSDPAQVSVLWQHCTGEPRENAPSILLHLIKHSSQNSPPNYKQIYSTGISVIFHI